MPRSYVYILTSQTRVLYVGMTNDIERRMHEHKAKAIEGFTARYNVNQLIYFEELADREIALQRETQLKGWSRSKKIALIDKLNPHWVDLSDRWYDEDAVEEGLRLSTVQSRLRPDPSTTASTPSLRI